MMSELQAVAGPISAYRRSTRVVENPVERFLVESERRVIVHCQKLLRGPNLSMEDQRRLERLLAEAEARLQERASIQINRCRNSKKILHDPLELCVRFCIWIFAA
jgi:hypothetical protein